MRKGGWATRDPLARQVVVVVAGPTGWCRDLVGCLGDHGFAVVVDSDGREPDVVAAGDVVAVVVDLGLRSRPATEVLAGWKRHSAAPVVAVAHDRDEATVLAAYAAGADQVAAVEVPPREMLARLRSLLRRVPPTRPAASEPTGDASLVIDADTGVVLIAGIKVDVTPAEFAVLRLLVERNGRLVARAELAAATARPGERSVDFFVRRLREKLEGVDGRRRIVAVRGVGFRLDAPPVAVSPLDPVRSAAAPAAFTGGSGA